ncbi:hypothetical protein ABZ572_13130 [Streptomyces sp. NPDC018338]|uniref:hypothetical protein n=1 Tax=Streptomyces sp. NPDC018338 TaxID=3157192 RepID=UPI0033F84FAA
MEQFVLTPEAGAWAPESWEQVRVFAVGGMQSRGLSDEARLRWGRLALSAISRRERGYVPQQAMAAAARVRAYMIVEFGGSDADVARDPSALCSNVLRHLGMSHEAAVRLAGDWRAAPREQMLQLRRIKNMLSPLVSVRMLLEGDEPVLLDTRAWLELIPRLP